MKFKLPSSKSFSVVKMFISIIAVPTLLVLITISQMQRQNTDHKVTHEVYFDIAIGGRYKGRMVFGLFGETVPATVQNFYTFATSGYKGLKYKNTRIHTVIKKLLIQGGDVIHNNGTGRVSIFGDSFDDENFRVHHTASGFLSMANTGPDTNGCQFLISTLATHWFDGKHVAFGKVIEGQALLHQIEYLDTDWQDRPLEEVKILRVGPRKISKEYWISDDPYNLRDWVKTISFPLALSFGIIYLFNYFIKKLDKFSDETDKAIAEDQKNKKVKKEKKPPKDSQVKNQVPPVVEENVFKNGIQNEEKEDVVKNQNINDEMERELRQRKITEE